MDNSEWSFRLELELERSSVRALWNEKLAVIPSTFARLIYLSSLRDPNNGRYYEAAMRERFGEEETDRALRVSHEITFWQWLCYGLEEQRTDLELYLSALRDNKRTILRTWLHLEPYRILIPESAREEERRLYLSGLGTVLKLLRSQFPAPESEA